MKETIEWFDYPDVKPEIKSPTGFLVSFVYPGCEESLFVTEAIFDNRDNEFYLTYKAKNPVKIGCDAVVVKWAHMPRGASNE